MNLIYLSGYRNDIKCEEPMISLGPWQKVGVKLGKYFKICIHELLVRI